MAIADASNKLDVIKIAKQPQHKHKKHKVNSTTNDTLIPTSQSTNELTLTQRKNLYKRQRRKQPCHACGKPGHTKQKCKNIFTNQYNDSICYVCREQGHVAKLCTKIQQPNIKHVQSKSDLVLCYNCGQTGHNMKQCNQAVIGDGYTHAECFVCHSKGHLASQCTQNEHGRYGVQKQGACHKCGSKQHLQKHCPVKDQADECMYICN